MTATHSPVNPSLQSDWPRDLIEKKVDSTRTVDSAAVVAPSRKDSTLAAHTQTMEHSKSRPSMPEMGGQAMWRRNREGAYHGPINLGCREERKSNLITASSYSSQVKYKCQPTLAVHTMTPQTISSRLRHFHSRPASCASLSINNNHKMT